MGDDAAFDRLRELQRELAAVADGRVDNGWVQWKRLQVDTLKWELAKRQPKKYGDKIEASLIGADGGPIQHTIIVQFVEPNGELWNPGGNDREPGRLIEAQRELLPAPWAPAESAAPPADSSRDFEVEKVC